MIRDRDRNKTIVCPRCQFFLGCIYRDEPGRQLEVFGIHLPSLLRRLPLIRSIRARPTDGPRTVSIRVAGQVLDHEDAIDASCEAWGRTD